MADDDAISNSLAEVVTDAAKKIVGPPAERIGGMLADLIDVGGGEYLRAIRLRNADKMQQETLRIIHERHAEERMIEPPLSIAKPIMESAADENREELQLLWARLLANAIDPTRADRVRVEFVDTLRKFHPLDAVILREMTTPTVAQNQQQTADVLRECLDLPQDEILVSLQQLQKLGCIETNIAARFSITPFGRQLLAALEP